MTDSFPDRGIFVYRKDGKEVAADPLKLDRRLTLALDGRPLAAADGSGLLDLMQSNDPHVAAGATESLLAAVRSAFGLTDLMPDGTGSTEEEQLDVLLAFQEWMAAQKKMPANSPT